jgi:hypothetical protein
MALSKKQMLIGGGVLLAGAGVFLLFRKPTKKFYDNIWCVDDDCSNIEEDYGSVQAYIDNQGIKNEDLREGGNNTGAVHLLFPEPHNLELGDSFYIKQDLGENATYNYDGEATVTRVVNKNIVRINKARQGSSGVEGGKVILPSVWNNISPF